MKKYIIENKEQKKEHYETAIYNVKHLSRVIDKLLKIRDDETLKRMKRENIHAIKFLENSIEAL